MEADTCRQTVGVVAKGVRGTKVKEKKMHARAAVVFQLAFVQNL